MIPQVQQALCWITKCKDTCPSTPEEFRCSCCKAAAAATASSARLLGAWQRSLPEPISCLMLPWRLHKQHCQALQEMAAGLSAMALPSLCLLVTEPRGTALSLGLLPAMASQACVGSRRQWVCGLQPNCRPSLASPCNHSTCPMFSATNEAAAETFWLEKVWWET